MAYGALLVGVLVFLYGITWGTQSPGQSFVVMATIPIAGLVAALAALRIRRLLLACVSAALAVAGIPLLISIVYLRAGV